MSQEIILSGTIAMSPRQCHTLLTESASEGTCAGLQDYVVKSERGRLSQPSSTVL